jgi:hypothetical protein
MSKNLVPEVIGPPYDLETLAQSVISSKYPGAENIVRDQLPPEVDTQFGIVLRHQRHEKGIRSASAIPTCEKGAPLASIDQWFNT